MSCFVLKIHPEKVALPLSSEVVDKNVVFEPPDFRREEIPEISDTPFQIALTSAHVAVVLVEFRSASSGE